MSKKETNAHTTHTCPVASCCVFCAVAAAVAALCCTREKERERERERDGTLRVVVVEKYNAVEWTIHIILMQSDVLHNVLVFSATGEKISVLPGWSPQY